MKKIFTIAWCIVSGLALTSCQSEAEQPQAITRAEGNVIYLDRLTTRSKEAKKKFQEIISSGNVFVDFYAEWCPPCRAMSPIIDQVAKQFPNITFVKVNIDTFLSLSQGIRSIPVIRLYKDGRQIYQQAGAIRNQKEMIKFLNKYF